MSCHGLELSGVPGAGVVTTDGVGAGAGMGGPPYAAKKQQPSEPATLEIATAPTTSPSASSLREAPRGGAAALASATSGWVIAAQNGHVLAGRMWR